MDHEICTVERDNPDISESRFIDLLSVGIKIGDTIMEVSATVENFNGITVRIKHEGTQIIEYFPRDDIKNKDAFADQLLAASEELARRRSDPIENNEWLSMLSAYLDSNDVETIQKFVSESGR